MSVTTTFTPPPTPVLDQLISEQDDAALTFAAQTLQDSTDRMSGLYYWTIMDELRRRHPEAWGAATADDVDWGSRSVIEMLLPHIAK